MDEVGFSYEEWYQQRARELGLKLFEALSIAIDINEGSSLRNPIKEKIVKLNLSDEKCVRCGVSMPFFTWGIQSGHCEDCIMEWEAKKSGPAPYRRGIDK